MQYNPDELNEILNIFKSESEEIIQGLNESFLELEKNPADKEPLKKLFRLAHSLKGAARMIGFNSIQDIAHKLEDVLSFWKQENVVINTDIFQEIYEICDFLSELVVLSVERKSDYSDKRCINFINKLDNFITSNHMIPVKSPAPTPAEYIKTKSVDINAFILELMFVLEMDKDNIEEIMLVIIEDVFQLEEIFKETDYTEIKNKIENMSEYTKKPDISSFDFSHFKSLVLDLRNDIYKLYKELNINLQINKIPEKNTVSEQKEQKEQKKEDNNSQHNSVNKMFDSILSNLQKIKYEHNSLILINNYLKDIIKNSDNAELEQLLSKTTEILSLFETKKTVIDNDCYMVILQCIYLAKRIFENGKSESYNNVGFLLQRLSVVEDMLNITETAKLSVPDRNEAETSIKKNEFSDIKNSFKGIDLSDIRTLRIDSSKIDNLISRTGEMLINGIKIREHIEELSNINSKMLKWNIVSKRIYNYLKYHEKKWSVNFNTDNSIPAVYKKAYTFLNENTRMVNELNEDFSKLYNIISEDGNKLHQSVLSIENIAKAIRVLPLATIFHSFPRMIRDIAKERNKSVDFIISGSDTTVDKKIIEEIRMPLIHILRNSVCHGIEEPDIRKKNNKSETGVIKLSAKQADNNVIIKIEDDGYGVNYEKIKSTAVNTGMLSREEAESLTEEQLMRLLFVPGFSTEETVNDLSGRGIGLDIVKTKITNLNGEINIDSELNKGCCVTIKIPVSTSTLKTFILAVNDSKYAIPVSAIKFVKQIKLEDISEKGGINYIIFENHSIPVYSMSAIFTGNTPKYDKNLNYTMIIVENQDKEAAFIVDKLLGFQEVFRKKLVPPIMKIKNISGFTTLTTGDICLIINPYELLHENPKSSDLLLLKSNEKVHSGKNIVIFNNAENNFNKVKEVITASFENTVLLNEINSIYDFINADNPHILICYAGSNDNETLEMIKHIKTDENYSALKVVMITNMEEDEQNIYLNGIKPDLTISTSEYNQTDLINAISDL